MIAAVKKVLASETAFCAFSAFVAISLLLPAGFISVAVVAFFAFALLNIDLSGYDIRKKWLLLVPILLFFLYLAGVLRSENAQDGIVQVTRRLPILLFPFGFSLLKKTDLRVREIETVLGLFLVACVVSSLVCYVHAVSNMIQFRSLSIVTERTYYLFSFVYLTEAAGITPIYLGLLVNLGFVISITTPFIKATWLRWVIAIYLLVFLILISSKIEIVISILILVTWLISHSNRLVRASVVLLIPTALICIVSFPFLRDRFIAPLKFDYREEYGHLWNSTSARMAIWSCASEAIERKPLAGYGTANGQIAIEAIFREKGFRWGLSQQYNCHNEFLSAELDLGIVGLITMVGMIGAAAYFSFNSDDFRARAFVIIILFTFLVESALLRQKGIVFFSFFFSLFFWSTPLNKGKS